MRKGKHTVSWSFFFYFFVNWTCLFIFFPNLLVINFFGYVNLSYCKSKVLWNHFIFYNSSVFSVFKGEQIKFNLYRVKTIDVWSTTCRTSLQFSILISKNPNVTIVTFLLKKSVFEGFLMKIKHIADWNECYILWKNPFNLERKIEILSFLAFSLTVEKFHSLRHNVHISAVIPNFHFVAGLELP